MTKNRIGSLLFAVLAAGALSVPAGAATVLTLDSSLLYVNGPQILHFAGTLENTGTEDVFINGWSLNAEAPLITNDAPFAAVPAVLAPGEVFSGSFFDIIVPPGIGQGLYPGVLDIIGGPDAASYDTIASATFAVQAVPEPATFGLMPGALGLLALLARRARKRR